jgi:aminopeptidase YwaD
MITAEERQLQTEIRGRNALNHIEKLCEFGFRFVGSEGDRKAIAYVEESFKSLGLKVEHTPIRVPTFEERCAELVLTDTSTALEAISPYFTLSGPRGGVKGELVFVGEGTEKDYDGRDVRGKIVVLQESGLGYSRFWLGTFAEMAAQYGAIGMVVIHPFPWPYRMSMEAGNSNLQKRFVKEQLPAVCISALDGLKLMHHLGQGKAAAFLNVETAIYDVESVVLSGVLEGSALPEERVAMIGHRDNGFPPGANDNGSGSGCLLELARVFSTRKPKRTLEFISSTAEEGVTIGAWSYLQANKARLHNMKALLDMDMFGTGGRLNLIEKGLWPDCAPIVHPEWLLQLLEGIADELGYYVGRMTATWGVAEEARFIDAGVPGAWFWKPDDMYYHSLHDTPDKIDGNSLKAVADITALAAWRIANQ